MLMSNTVRAARMRRKIQLAGAAGKN
jgi:hypothetical protein